MKKFGVLVHGINFLIPSLGKQTRGLVGFWSTAYVEAASEREAEEAAVALFRDDPELRAQTENSTDDPPRLFVDEIAELSDWPRMDAPSRSGLAFYSDPTAEWLLKK